MIRDVTLGQYIPGNGVVHRADPRLKVILLIAFITLIFCAFNFVSLAITAVGIAVTLLLSDVSLKLYFKSLKVILFIVLFTSVLNLFYGTGTPICEFWVFKITLSGIYRAVFVSVRIMLLILVSSCLTFTTSPTEIAMMMTIALRFVPTLLEETDKIMAAQKARGADMESGGIIKKVKALTPVLIPLFVSAFRRAFELAMAMECRCYQGGDGRTRMKSLHLQKLDALCIVFMLLLVAGVVIGDIFVPPVI